MWGVEGRWQLVQHVMQGSGLQLCRSALQWGGECLYWHLLVQGVVSRDLGQELSPLYIEYFPNVHEKDRFLYSFPVIESLVCLGVFLG